MNTFKSLGLSENLLKVLEEKGFKEPTPIQEKSIPLLLSKSQSDFIGLAQTGTGKTAAFGLPLLDLIDGSDNHVQALILAPTRELGQQTAKQIEELSAHYKKLNVEVVYGGAAISNQIRALKKPTQLVVATPGRLLDLIRRRSISLDKVQYVVLDEADEMLNMGFKEDIDDILANIQVPHATWLFSATMPKEIRRIVKKYMNDPAEVSIDSDQKTNVDITHQYIVTKTADKLAALQRFLDIEPEMKGIMFCRTKRETQEITDQLAKIGYEVEALHGDLSQAQRDAAMRRFKTRNMQLLVATDVAARGIDVNDLTHVFHHKLPDQLEAYTHRSGRTARAGKKGLSIAFINSREGRKISDLERKLKIQFEKIEVPSMNELKEVRLEKWVKQLHAMPVHKKAKEVLKDLEGHLVNLSKEDLLERLISQEIEQMDRVDAGDLNMSTEKGGKGDRNSRNRDDNSPFQRYFVNIGTTDGLNERELVQFISDVGNVKTKHITDISLQDKRAFFTLDSSQTKGFEEKFVGLEMDNGHEIRVNQEHNRGPKGKGGGRGRNERFRGGKGRGKSKGFSKSKGRGRGRR